MPELPEVETIVQDLEYKLKGHIINRIWTDWPRSFHPNLGKVRKEIRGRKIIKIRRRAKNILIDLTSGKTLLIHLKMTGNLLYRERDWKKKASKKDLFFDPYNQFVRTIFYFDRGKELAFSDLRRFGEIMIFDTEKENEIKRLRELGPEPLDKKFTFAKFNGILKGKNGQIKSLLMDQAFIAGIGNIYSDEILWEAKIHPKKKSDKFTIKEKEKLFQSIKKVLKKAIKSRGTSISDFRDTDGEKGGYQKIKRVYQREAEKCFRCDTIIRRIKINNRGTSFCPRCQPLDVTRG